MAISDRKLGITYNNGYLSCAKRERERGRREGLVNTCYSYETRWVSHLQSTVSVAFRVSKDILVVSSLIWQW